MTVELTGSTLTLEEVVRVARHGEQVSLGADVAARVQDGRRIVEDAVGGAPVYGLSTGVGVRKRTAVDAKAMAAFNDRLILDHRVGQGAAAPQDVVRTQLLLVLNGFARGTSGVRPELLEHLLEQLNDGRPLEVRMLGSIGMADLPANADLAHAALEGFPLAAKEGLALLSHNGFSTALAALAFTDAVRLLDWLDVAAALDLEALGANLSMLEPAAGRHETTVERLGTLLAGSYLWDEGAARNLQDPLTFRCVPQVHGAARDAFGFARERIMREFNTSQENPLVLLEERRIVSVGNFDALALAAAIDLVRIALVPVLTSAAERAVKLLQSPVTGLPEGLAARAGTTDSGLSEFGVPLQALAAEAKLLAQPVSVETASTSHHEGIEDRVSLAPLGARRLAELVELGGRVAAIELVIAAQAVDLRGSPRLGASTAAVHAAIRRVVSPLEDAAPPPQDLEPVRALLGRVIPADRGGS